jgi:hypothetical protein
LCGFYKQEVLRSTGDGVVNVPIRRIRIEGGGQCLLVPHLPLLSSASRAWDGFLLERHLSNGFAICAEGRILVCGVNFPGMQPWGYTGARIARPNAELW